MRRRPPAGLVLSIDLENVADFASGVSVSTSIRAESSPLLSKFGVRGVGVGSGTVARRDARSNSLAIPIGLCPSEWITVCTLTVP